MTRWPRQRTGAPLVAATDDELIAGSNAWHDICPRGGRGNPAWEKWRADFSAWCADRGTDPLQLLRLRAQRKGRARTYARREAWRDGPP